LICDFVIIWRVLEGRLWKRNTTHVDWGFRSKVN